jgi:chromosome segregation ATPase
MSLVDLEARRKLQYLNDRIEGLSKVLANLESLVHVQRELVSAHGNSITEISVALAEVQAPREGIEERLNEHRADLRLLKEAMEQLVSGSHAVSDCITDMELRLQALEGNAPFRNPLDEPPFTITYKEPEKKPISQEPVSTVKEWQGEKERFRLGWLEFGIGESIPSKAGILVTLPDGSETTVIYDRSLNETL